MSYKLGIYRTLTSLEPLPNSLPEGWRIRTNQLVRIVYRTGKTLIVQHTSHERLRATCRATDLARVPDAVFQLCELEPL